MSAVLADELLAELNGSQQDVFGPFAGYLREYAERVRDMSDSGGSSAAVVRGPFAFAFDTPGLADGVAFYTPTVDDILLDAWIEIDTSFDGTTPSADIGTFAASSQGVWFAWNVPLALNEFTDAENSPGYLNSWRPGPSLALAGAAFQNAAQDQSNLVRIAPGKFTTDDPWLLVVSQDGTKGGTPIDSTVGAARVYLVTATPTPFT